LRACCFVRLLAKGIGHSLRRLSRFPSRKAAVAPAGDLFRGSFALRLSISFSSRPEFPSGLEEKSMNCDKELDVRGLNCPLPILRTKKSLVDMTTGQVLKILATDPGAVIDFQVFADQTGNELLSSSETAGEFMFYMKKK
jgi:tRNA 2-thiouridine synthesizing protein A